MSKTSDIVASKIKSRKFLAYCIGMVSLLVAGFTKLIPAEDISGIFKVISLRILGSPRKHRRDQGAWWRDGETK